MIWLSIKLIQLFKLTANQFIFSMFRDSAVKRKNSAEVELARARIDVMQVCMVYVIIYLFKIVFQLLNYV